MKTIRIVSFFALLFAISQTAFSQDLKTETFAVSGVCGSCKKNIEKAARDAGASSALWNMDTKILKVSYDGSATTTAAIQQKIAAVGYDTPQYKATDAAYSSLDQCCQYARDGKTATKAKACKKGGKCVKEKAATN